MARVNRTASRDAVKERTKWLSIQYYNLLFPLMWSTGGMWALMEISVRTKSSQRDREER